MKQFMIVAVLLLGSFALRAQEESNNRITALFIMSSDSRDFIGRGREKAYYPEDGNFRVSRSQHDGAIRIDFHSNENREWWSLNFGGSNRENPSLGVSVNAKRYPFSDDYPGFPVSSDHRGCNRLGGQFEIRELEYNDKGTVTAFAANFVQRCGETGPPLFGSVRINSSVPIETRFEECIQKKFSPSVIYVSKHHPLTGGVHTTLLPGNLSDLKIRHLPFGGEGIEVVVEGEDGNWVFDFAAPIGSEFATGIYEASCRYPFHSHFEAGVAVAAANSAAAQPYGIFKVLEVQRTVAGKIAKLKLEFTIETEAGETYEGIIRYLSEDIIPFQNESDDDDF